jgi:hypothetical protein
MKKLLLSFVYSGVIILIVAILGTSWLEAGIRKDREDNVALGKWQPPKSNGKRGYFLSEETFEPGDKLAVKIFLEKPKERVSVKVIVKVPEKPDKVSEKIVKDGGKSDLLPKEQNIILLELTEILPDEKAAYIVEIDDKTGLDPVVKSLETSGGYSKFFGKTVSRIANTLLSIPVTISEAMLFGGRNLVEDPLRTLVIADAEGQIQDMLTPSEEGVIQFPIWLPDDQILFVESDNEGSTLKVVKVDSMTFKKGSLRDFGTEPTEGTEPHLTPDQKSIIFRQGSTIMSANLSGTDLVSLIHDKKVHKILGVFADSDLDSYNLVFEEDDDILWLTKIKGTEIIPPKRIPYSDYWRLLTGVHFYGEHMLYEFQDKIKKEDKQEIVWNIYLSQTPEKEGKKITTDEHNDRYPAWSPDGTKIVYASGKVD